MHDLTQRAGHNTKWLLNSLHAGELPASTPVGKRGLTLGRNADNTIPIPAQLFPGVSGHHARLLIEGGRLMLEDLQSSNGTLIAGRPIEREVLRHGAVFELGTGGPRFVAISSAKLDKTVAMPRPHVVTGRQSGSIGTETMLLVREKLGIPGSASVEQMVSSKSNHTRLMMLVVTLVLVAVIGVVYRLSDKTQEELAQQNVDLRNQLELQGTELAARNASMDDARLAWEAEKKTLEQERNEIEKAIEAVQKDEESTSSELQTLRSQLLDTNSTLEMYNPVNLEQQRLKEVSRVERCTVLIEADQVYVDENTGQVLHIASDGPFGSRVNLDSEGEPLLVEATGSGFSLTSEGWIITNAHVVHKKHTEPSVSMGPGVSLVPRVDLHVVFSGESKRHVAKLVKWVSSGREDLALLKIEPFEGMPYLEAPDLDAPPPTRGTEVFLIGFPLGKRVFHQGDTMLASTFKGVLSRVLDEYLQVDAAVHPGASGGPLIDGSGRILGVVVGMQSMDEASSSSAIGYIIPVKDIGAIWPPPSDE